MNATDATSLLTIGSVLLTVELLCLQLSFFACNCFGELYFFADGVSYLHLEVFCLQLKLFCLELICVSENLSGL